MTLSAVGILMWTQFPGSGGGQISPNGASYPNEEGLASVELVDVGGTSLREGRIEVADIGHLEGTLFYSTPEMSIERVVHPSELKLKELSRMPDIEWLGARVNGRLYDIHSRPSGISLVPSNGWAVEIDDANVQSSERVAPEFKVVDNYNHILDGHSPNFMRPFSRVKAPVLFSSQVKDLPGDGAHVFFRTRDTAWKRFEKPAPGDFPTEVMQPCGSLFITWNGVEENGLTRSIQVLSGGGELCREWTVNRSGSVLIEGAQCGDYLVDVSLRKRNRSAESLKETAVLRDYQVTQVDLDLSLVEDPGVSEFRISLERDGLDGVLTGLLANRPLVVFAEYIDSEGVGHQVDPIPLDAPPASSASQYLAVSDQCELPSGDYRFFLQGTGISSSVHLDPEAYVEIVLDGAAYRRNVIRFTDKVTGLPIEPSVAGVRERLEYGDVSRIYSCPCDLSGQHPIVCYSASEHVVAIIADSLYGYQNVTTTFVDGEAEVELTAQGGEITLVVDAGDALLANSLDSLRVRVDGVSVQPTSIMSVLGAPGEQVGSELEYLVGLPVGSIESVIWVDRDGRVEFEKPISLSDLESDRVHVVR